jgi:peptidoglycan/LPS O-acetylase OafA/YrhL
VKSGQKDIPLFLTLDGMRGIGAILVVYGHTMVFWGGPAVSFPPIPFCVDLFFILSGYVIAFAYEPRLSTGMTAATFIRQRLTRLYPLYLLGLMMGLVAFLIAGLGDPAKMGAVGLSLIPQLFMLPSPDLNGSGDLYPLNMPSWTLLFELAANVVFVLIYKWLSTRNLVIVVALSAAALAACAIAYGTIDQGPSWWNFWGGFARAMFGFFCGVLIFRTARSPKAPPVKRSLWAIPATLVVIALCFIPQTPATRPFVELFIVCIVGFPLVWWGQSMQPPRWIAGAFAKLGAISYAVYMIHYPLYEFMKRANWKFPQLSHEWAPWTGLVLMLVTLALGWIAEQYYDRPVRRALNGWFKALEKRKAKPAAPMVPAE